MKLEIITQDSRLIPSNGSAYAAGYDLRAAIDEPITIWPETKVLIPTGVSISPTPQESREWVALIFPRSGLALKHNIVLGNLTGVMDADYQGVIKLYVWNTDTSRRYVIEPEERLAQIVFLPILRPTFIQVESFSNTTDRNVQGFGSTQRF